MATENTNIMVDLFMTPEVNRYNEAMGVIEDLLYQTAEGQREGVFMTAINSILSNAVFRGLITHITDFQRQKWGNGYKRSGRPLRCR